MPNDKRPVPTANAAPLRAVERAPIALESFAPLAGADAEQVLAMFCEKFPDLRELLRVGDLEARIEWLRENCSVSPALYPTLLSLQHTMRKAGRFREALDLGRLRLELVELQPEDLLTSFMDRSTYRNRGDALDAIADSLEDLGDLGAALTARSEAELYYDRDAQLKLSAGLTRPLETDRLFHSADFRSANLADIARLYQRLNQPDRAAEYHKLAWKYSQRDQTADDKVERLMDQGRGYEEAGDLDGALSSFWQALDLALTLTSSQLTGQSLVTALRHLAGVYRQLGLYRRAAQLYERSLDINEKVRHTSRQLEDLQSLAYTYALRGDVSSALRYYDRSLRLCCVPASSRASGTPTWQIEGTSHQIVRMEAAASILLAMARLKRSTDPEAATFLLTAAAQCVERVRASVHSDQSRVSYQATAGEVFDELIDLTAEQYQRSPNQAALEQLFEWMERAKSRVLAEMLADQPLHPQGVPADLLHEESRLLEREAQLKVQMEQSSASIELADGLDEVERELEAIWTRIQQTSDGERYVALRRAQPIDSHGLRALLGSNASVAVVNYYATSTRLLALIVRADRPDLSLAVSAQQRDELKTAALVDPDDPPALDLRIPYWQLDFPSVAIDPVRPLIAGAEHLVLVPHDVLHSIPLHALAAPGTRALVLDHTISFSPSASLLRFALAERKRATGPALVLGAPVRPDEKPIPGAAEEIVAVARSLGCAPYVQEHAQRALVLERAGEASFIHLACHNRFDEIDPLASALQLSDGDLSARDIFGMRISPELVVLSACQSGVSGRQAGDELIGIVRALLFAGAPSVIVSLWNAYDGITSELMTDFYQKLASDSKGTALSRSQSKFAAAGVPVSKWAPFVLVGAWR